MNPRGPISLRVTDVSKSFHGRRIFERATFVVDTGGILVLTGKNGSGKSTLLKIIARQLTPSQGKVEYHLGEAKIDDEALQSEIGFVAPYLELYAELTAQEHINFVCSLRGQVHPDIDALLVRVGLDAIRDKHLLVGAYSSGMKQRLRFAIALAISPSVLLLDEPTSNLDQPGIAIVNAIILGHQSAGGLTIIASNEAREIDLATKQFAIPEVPERISSRAA